MRRLERSPTDTYTEHNRLSTLSKNTTTGIEHSAEFNAPPDTVQVILEAIFTANHLTVTDIQTIREIVSINHKNTHINTIPIKENKQLNIQQKQNYPGSVAFYDSRPGNEVGLFYNGPSKTRAKCTTNQEVDRIASR